MVKHSRVIRAGPKFLDFQATWRRNIKPLIGRSDRHIVESPWLTDRIAEILEDDLDFTRSTMRQLQRKKARRRRV